MKAALCLFASLLVLLSSVSSPADETLDCSRTKDSLPNPSATPGTRDSINPIEHVIVVVQENHSFDTYFGGLNSPEFYGSEVDGLTSDMTNMDRNGNLVHPFHQTNYCPPTPLHTWEVNHNNWNHGLNDHFVISNDQRGTGSRALGFYDSTDLNYYYALASTFAVGDRYFSSVMGPTLPNRFYIMAGTSFGHTNNDIPGGLNQFSQETLFDRLTKYGISWKYYFTDAPYLGLFLPSIERNRKHVVPIYEYKKDLSANQLPEVVFLESAISLEDEHPPGNIQLGQNVVAGYLEPLFKSTAWKSTAVFLTYDEAGGFYDHVNPPKACKTDDINPIQSSGHPKPEGGFDQLGFRVPFVVISPYAKHHYVSHVNYEHASVVKFIESKFNIPALSARDANSEPLMDFFDFNQPNFESPLLPKPDFDWKRFKSCLL